MLAPTLVFAQYVVVHVVANWSGSDDPRGAPGTGLCLGHCSTIQRPVIGEHDTINLAAPQHLAAAQEVRKRARVTVYSVHGITMRPCAQVGTMPMPTTTTSEGDASTTKQRRTTQRRTGDDSLQVCE